MFKRRSAPFVFIGGGALLFFAVLATIVWFSISEGPAEADDGVCKGIEFVATAPARNDLAFGPDVRAEIADFDKLSPEKQVELVIEHQQATWCRFPAVALANAMHRGVRNWPTSADEWLAQLKVLTEDRDAHHKLVDRMLKWEEDNVVKVEVVYNSGTYLSDWFDRTSGQPVLVRGSGHAVEAGWVIRRTLKDGTVLDERLVCMYQLAGEVPPLGPPPTPPPTTGGKDASQRPPQDPVITCPSGQFADRNGVCTPYSATTTTIYNNDGGNSGPGAPGPGVSTPPEDTVVDITVPTNTGPGDGSIPNPDA